MGHGANGAGTGSDADNDVVVSAWEATVTLLLGAGDDTASVSQTEWATGPHAIDLGSGTDHLNYRGYEQDVALDLTTGTLDTTPAGMGSAVGVESATVIAYSAKIAGTDAPNDLAAFGCELGIEGRGGDDTLTADRTDPLFDESFGCQRTRSTILGGAGRDHLTGFDRADTLKGGGGRDTLRGANGNDRLVGGAGHDRANGSKGRDSCVAEVTRSCESGR